jgi:hypothetical protein
MGWDDDFVMPATDSEDCMLTGARVGAAVALSAGDRVRTLEVSAARRWRLCSGSSSGRRNSGNRNSGTREAWTVLPWALQVVHALFDEMALVSWAWKSAERLVQE